jgi:hypothetical protein
MASVRSVDCGVALVVAMMTVARVAGHASVIMPPSRNAVDGVMPGTPWSGGKVETIMIDSNYPSQ